MIHFFLEKADLRKLDLLRYLENSISHQVLRESIIRDLGITEFLLNKVIEELNLDIQKYGLYTDFKLEASSLGVKLIKNKKCPSKKLEICLIRDSLTFSLMIALFFEEFVSINHYAENNFLSYSSVYNKLLDIKVFVKTFSFKVTKKNKIRGNESNIRLFFSYLFLKMNDQSLIMYSESTKNKSLKLLNSLEKYRGKPFKESEKIKLIHYLNVMAIRNTQDNYINNDSFHVSKDYLESSEIAIFLLEEFDKLNCQIPKNKKLNEVDGLLSYLVAKKYIELEDYLTNTLNQVFKIYSYNFMNEVKIQYPDLIRFIDINSHRIDLIHFNILNFVLPLETELRSQDIKAITKGYPDFIEFNEKYINKQKNNSEIWKNYDYVFDTYLLILINGEMTKETHINIYLYVDFLFGRKYSNLVIDIIKSYTRFEIVFQDNVNEQTNLILSDIYFESYPDINQIVWETSPTAKDWEKFVMELEQIRKQTIKY